MKLTVYEIDAWRNPDGTWQYNNWFKIGKITAPEKMTSRSILKALRESNYLLDKSIYKVDHYFNYNGTWTILLKNNNMPLLELVDENHND